MTYERREQILSKDIISVSEIKELLGTDESTASRIRTNIHDKLQQLGTLRYDARGKLHTQDFCDYFNIERR